MEDYDPACPTEDDYIIPDIDLSQVPLPPPPSSQTNKNNQSTSSSQQSEPTSQAQDEESSRRGKKKKKKKKKGQDRKRSSAEDYDEELEDGNKQAFDDNGGAGGDTGYRGKEVDNIQGDKEEHEKPDASDDKLEAESQEIVTANSDQELRITHPKEESKKAKPSETSLASKQPQPAAPKLQFKLKTDPESGKAKVSFNLGKSLRRGIIPLKTVEKEEKEEKEDNVEDDGNRDNDNENSIVKTAGGEVLATRFKVAKKFEMFRPDMLVTKQPLVVQLPTTTATTLSAVESVDVAIAPASKSKIINPAAAAAVAAVNAAIAASESAGSITEDTEADPVKREDDTVSEEKKADGKEVLDDIKEQSCDKVDKDRCDEKEKIVKEKADNEEDEKMKERKKRDSVEKSKRSTRASSRDRTDSRSGRDSREEKSRRREEKEDEDRRDKDRHSRYSKRREDRDYLPSDRRSRNFRRSRSGSWGRGKSRSKSPDHRDYSRRGERGTRRDRSRNYDKDSGIYNRRRERDRRGRESDIQRERSKSKDRDSTGKEAKEKSGDKTRTKGRNRERSKSQEEREVRKMDEKDRKTSKKMDDNDKNISKLSEMDEEIVREKNEMADREVDKKSKLVDEDSEKRKEDTDGSGDGNESDSMENKRNNKKSDENDEYANNDSKMDKEKKKSDDNDENDLVNSDSKKEKGNRKKSHDSDYPLDVVDKYDDSDERKHHNEEVKRDMKPTVSKEMSEDHEDNRTISERKADSEGRQRKGRKGDDDPVESEVKEKNKDVRDKKGKIRSRLRSNSEERDRKEKEIVVDRKNRGKGYSDKDSRDRSASPSDGNKDWKRSKREIQDENLTSSSKRERRPSGDEPRDLDDNDRSQGRRWHRQRWSESPERIKQDSRQSKPEKDRTIDDKRRKNEKQDVGNSSVSLGQVFLDLSAIPEKSKWEMDEDEEEKPSNIVVEDIDEISEREMPRRFPPQRPIMSSRDLERVQGFQQRTSSSAGRSGRTSRWSAAEAEPREFRDRRSVIEEERRAKYKKTEKIDDKNKDKEDGNKDKEDRNKSKDDRNKSKDDKNRNKDGNSDEDAKNISEESENLGDDSEKDRKKSKEKSSKTESMLSFQDSAAKLKDEDLSPELSRQNKKAYDNLDIEKTKGSNSSESELEHVDSKVEKSSQRKVSEHIKSEKVPGRSSQEDKKSKSPIRMKTKKKKKTKKKLKSRVDTSDSSSGEGEVETDSPKDVKDKQVTESLLHGKDKETTDSIPVYELERQSRDCFEHTESAVSEKSRYKKMHLKSDQKDEIENTNLKDPIERADSRTSQRGKEISRRSHSIDRESVSSRDPTERSESRSSQRSRDSRRRSRSHDRGSNSSRDLLDRPDSRASQRSLDKRNRSRSPKRKGLKQSRSYQHGPSYALRRSWSRERREGSNSRSRRSSSRSPSRKDRSRRKRSRSGSNSSSSKDIKTRSVDDKKSKYSIHDKKSKSMRPSKSPSPGPSRSQSSGPSRSQSPGPSRSQSPENVKKHKKKKKKKEKEKGKESKEIEPSKREKRYDDFPNTAMVELDAIPVPEDIPMPSDSVDTSSSKTRSKDKEEVTGKDDLEAVEMDISDDSNDQEEEEKLFQKKENLSKETVRSISAGSSMDLQANQGQKSKKEDKNVCQQIKFSIGISGSSKKLLKPLQSSNLLNDGDESDSDKKVRRRRLLDGCSDSDDEDVRIKSRKHKAQDNITIALKASKVSTDLTTLTRESGDDMEENATLNEHKLETNDDRNLTSGESRETKIELKSDDEGNSASENKDMKADVETKPKPVERLKFKYIPLWEMEGEKRPSPKYEETPVNASLGLGIDYDSNSSDTEVEKGSNPSPSKKSPDKRLKKEKEECINENPHLEKIDETNLSEKIGLTQKHKETEDCPGFVSRSKDLSSEKATDREDKPFSITAKVTDMSEVYSPSHPSMEDEDDMGETVTTATTTAINSGQSSESKSSDKNVSSSTLPSAVPVSTPLLQHGEGPSLLSHIPLPTMLQPVGQQVSVQTLPTPNNSASQISTTKSYSSKFRISRFDQGPSPIQQLPPPTQILPVAPPLQTTAKLPLTPQPVPVPPQPTQAVSPLPTLASDVLSTPLLLPLHQQLQQQHISHTSATADGDEVTPSETLVTPLQVFSTPLVTSTATSSSPPPQISVVSKSDSKTVSPRVDVTESVTAKQPLSSSILRQSREDVSSKDGDLCISTTSMDHQSSFENSPKNQTDKSSVSRPVISSQTKTSMEDKIASVSLIKPPVIFSSQDIASDILLSLQDLSSIPLPGEVIKPSTSLSSPSVSSSSSISSSSSQSKKGIPAKIDKGTSDADTTVHLESVKSKPNVSKTSLNQPPSQITQPGVDHSLETLVQEPLPSSALSTSLSTPTNPSNEIDQSRSSSLLPQSASSTALLSSSPAIPDATACQTMTSISTLQSSTSILESISSSSSSTSLSSSSSSSGEKKKRFLQSPLAIGLLPKIQAQSPLSIGPLPKLAPVSSKEQQQSSIIFSKSLVDKMKTKNVSSGSSLSAAAPTQIASSSTSSSRIHMVLKNKISTVSKTIVPGFEDDGSDSEGEMKAPDKTEFQPPTVDSSESDSTLPTLSDSTLPTSTSVSAICSIPSLGQLPVRSSTEINLPGVLADCENMAKATVETFPVKVITSTRVGGEMPRENLRDFDAVNAKSQRDEDDSERVSISSRSTVKERRKRDEEGKESSKKDKTDGEKRRLSRADERGPGSGGSGNQRKIAQTEELDFDLSKVKKEKEDDYEDRSKSKKKIGDGKNDKRKTPLDSDKERDKHESKRSRDGQFGDHRKRRAKDDHDHDDGSLDKKHGNRNKDRSRSRSYERERSRDWDSRARDKKRSRERSWEHNEGSRKGSSSNRSSKRSRRSRERSRSRSPNSRRRDSRYERKRSWERDYDDSANSGRGNRNRDRSRSRDRDYDRKSSRGGDFDRKRSRSRERDRRSFSSGSDQDRGRSRSLEKSLQKRKPKRSAKEDFLEEVSKIDAAYSSQAKGSLSSSIPSAEGLNQGGSYYPNSAGDLSGSVSGMYTDGHGMAYMDQQQQSVPVSVPNYTGMAGYEGQVHIPDVANIPGGQHYNPYDNQWQQQQSQSHEQYTIPAQHYPPGIPVVNEHGMLQHQQEAAYPPHYQHQQEHHHHHHQQQHHPPQPHLPPQQQFAQQVPNQFPPPVPNPQQPLQQHYLSQPHHPPQSVLPPAQQNPHDISHTDPSLPLQNYPGMHLPPQPVGPPQEMTEFQTHQLPISNDFHPQHQGPQPPHHHNPNTLVPLSQGNQNDYNFSSSSKEITSSGASNPPPVIQPSQTAATSASSLPSSLVDNSKPTNKSQTLPDSRTVGRTEGKPRRSRFSAPHDHHHSNSTTIYDDAGSNSSNINPMQELLSKQTPSTQQLVAMLSAVESNDKKDETGSNEGYVKKTLPEPEDAAAMESMVSSSGVEDTQVDNSEENSSGTESSTMRPLKVKSRWRRNSEAEAVADTSLPQSIEPAPKSGTDSLLSTSDDNVQPRSKKPLKPEKNENVDDKTKQTKEKRAGKHEEKMDSVESDTIPEGKEEDLESVVKRTDFPKFEIITENIHLTERKRSKSMKRMTCDCTTSREDRANDIPACGSDCLNRMLMIECGSRCPCGDHCTNKRFQRKQYSKTIPLKTPEKGWGLQAMEDMLDSGTFVMEYVGELLGYDEFVRRTRQYSKAGMIHHYFMALNADEVVDATLKGSISRFINHSCDPNCETQKWTVNGELRVGFFTRKPITKGEELTFDYQFEHYGEAQKCYCGAEKCRGYIGLVKSTSSKQATVTTSKKKDRKKKANFQDELLEEDISHLSQLDGMRNKTHVLDLCRVMVRAEKVLHRVAILKILQSTKEPACLRLFLDYHGLSLFWSWMTDINTADYSDDTEEFKLLMLSVLKALPITNKTVLKESKILPVVERWAVAAVAAARKPPPPPPTSSIASTSSTSSLSSTKTSSESDNLFLTSSSSSDIASSSSSSSSSTTAAASGTENVTTSDNSNEAESLAQDVSAPPTSTTPPPCTSTSPPPSSSSSSSPPTTPLPLPASNIVPVSILSSTDKSKEGKKKRRVTFAEEHMEASFSPEPEDTEGISSSTVYEECYGEAAPLKDHNLLAEETEDGLNGNTSVAGEADSTSQKDSSQDDSAGVSSDTDTSDVEYLTKDPLTSLASELLCSWSGLKEVFKIPKKERVEERKRTERELDVLSKKESTVRDPYAKWKKKNVRSSRKRSLDEDDRKTSAPKMSKEEREERRQRFEAQVKAEDQLAAQAAAEEMQRQQEEFMLHQQRLMEDPQYFYYHQQQQEQQQKAGNSGEGGEIPPQQVLDPVTGLPMVDPVTGQPILQQSQQQPQPFIDPITGQPLTPQLDPVTGQPVLDPVTGQPVFHVHEHHYHHHSHPDPSSSGVPVVDPNTGQPVIDPNTGQPLIEHEHPPIDPNTGQPVVDPNTYQHLIDPNTGQPVIDPKTGQPVIDPNTGQPIIDPNTGQPVAHHLAFHTHPTDPHHHHHHHHPHHHHHSTANSNTQQIDPVTGQPIVAAPSPHHHHHHHPSQEHHHQLDPLTGQPMVIPATSQPPSSSTSGFIQSQVFGDPTSTSMLPPGGIESEEEIPPPPSPPSVPVTKLPPNWKTAKDAEGRVYYYHAFTRQTQWEMPSWDDNVNDSDNEMDLDPLPSEDVKQSKRKTTTAAADTSSELAKKYKEQFRCKMSSFIVLCLNPFRKSDCKIGRIASTEDFKYLARKLTHHVMSKELKHCRHVEDLEVNENVKAKAKDYVRKYMSKFGSLYRRTGSPQAAD